MPGKWRPSAKGALSTAHSGALEHLSPDAVADATSDS